MGLHFYYLQEKDFKENFREIYVPIKFPECIYEFDEKEPNRYLDELNGSYSFSNILTSFKYNNEAIEYDGDLVDRGYDHLITIVKVDKGEPSLVYRYYQLDESESTEKWYN